MYCESVKLWKHTAIACFKVLFLQLSRGAEEDTQRLRLVTQSPKVHYFITAFTKALTCPYPVPILRQTNAVNTRLCLSHLSGLSSGFPINNICFPLLPHSC
jgi:hypothetical protein